MKTRDERGRFASGQEEMTEEQREAIVYRSKLLNKTFDSWEELKKAEQAYNDAHAKELAEKQKRQEAVAGVQKAAEDYLALIEKNKQVRHDLAKAEEEAYQAYRKTLNEFSKEHKGYHLTYTFDGENIEFKVEEDRQQSLRDYVEYQNKLLNTLFKDFWF